MTWFCLIVRPHESHEELRLSRIYLAFCNDCCGVTEAARRDGGAAEGKAALAEEEEGAPKGPKALLMVVKDVLRGLFTNAVGGNGGEREARKDGLGVKLKEGERRV